MQKVKTVNKTIILYGSVTEFCYQLSNEAWTEAQQPVMQNVTLNCYCTQLYNDLSFSLLVKNSLRLLGMKSGGFLYFL